MAAKVFESIGKFGLALAVAGGVVNSALYNGEALRGGGSLPFAGGFPLVCTAHVTLLVAATVCECVCDQEGYLLPSHAIWLPCQSSLSVFPHSHRFSQGLSSQRVSQSTCGLNVPSCSWWFEATLPQRVRSALFTEKEISSAPSCLVWNNSAGASDLWCSNPTGRFCSAAFGSFQTKCLRGALPSF